MIQKIVLFIIKVARKLLYNTPVHRLKLVNIIYEKLFHAGFGKTQNIQIDYEGCKFNVPTKDITILPSLLNDCYEKEEIKFLRNLLKPGNTFVDIGANIGIFTAIGAKKVGKAGKVYAFEPEPQNYALLNDNILLNNFKNIHTENLAIGNRAATQKLNLERNSIGTHSILRRSTSIEKAIDVKVIRLDDYFLKLDVDIRIMKIDVEGYEPYVLEGAKKTLLRVDYLLLEYTSNDFGKYGIDKFIKLLKDFPYIYGINERRHTITPFSTADFYSVKYINIIASKCLLANSFLNN